jgi:hypothetical protein
MNGPSPPDRQSMIALGVLLALGLIIGGWVMGAQIKATGLAIDTSR